MTDKELRRLSRMELIQLLLEQTRETERLQAELGEMQERLNDRRILLHNAGSIAEAAVQINELMETAQATADQWLERMKQEYTDRIQREYDELKKKMDLLEQATKRRCAQMLQEAKEEAATYGGDT